MTSSWWARAAVTGGGWREDPDNPESDIDVAAAHEWFRNLPDPR